MKIIGTGIDIVESARLAESIQRHGERFLARVFTEGERQYCAAMKKPETFYAARFAAKEAVSKAFGTGIGAQLGWLDIEVRRKASGEPFVVLSGEGATSDRAAPGDCGDLSFAEPLRTLRGGPRARARRRGLNDLLRFVVAHQIGI